jgi:hypothetical protein
MQYNQGPVNHQQCDGKLHHVLFAVKISAAHQAAGIGHHNDSR